jgi:hypothetical protein
MATFPLLSTGAVTQYPLGISSYQATQVLRFLDGSDQRFSTQAKALRRWSIRLELLTEDELQQIETFFAEQLGGFQKFDFPDPYSGVVVPNCRFAADGIMAQYDGPDVTATSFSVIETNG